MDTSELFLRTHLRYECTYIHKLIEYAILCDQKRIYEFLLKLQKSTSSSRKYENSEYGP